MNDNAKAVREKVTRCTAELERAKAELARLEISCKPHLFGDTVYDPIIREGFDAELPMGCGPHTYKTYIPREEKKRWRRECKTCGLVEYTVKTEEHVTEKPRW